MEITTNNNVETRQEGTPPAEPVQSRQPEKPTQPGETNFQESMMRMLMELKEDNRDLNKKLDDHSNALMEELNKKLDDNNKNLESMNKKIESWSEDNRKWRKERKDDGKPAIEEVPNDETMEELSLQSQDDGKQTENKEDSKALLFENKHHRSEEIIQHKEVIIESVNNQAIQKTEDKEIENQMIKKKEERRMIRPRKVRITQEILEMTRSGLINFMDNPIIKHRTRINGKKYEKNFIKILKVNHHKIVNKNLNKDIFKSNMPISEIHQTRSFDSLMNNRPLKYLINNPDDGTIKTTLHISNYGVTEKVISNEIFKVNTPRGRMLRKKKENYQKQMDRIIEGYAQAIRKLRKERNQSTENSRQETTNQS